MTFQKQECKCLVSNQSLCKLMKEQFGFVCRSFGLFWFVCQSNSVYQCGTERRENSKLHATQATCQFESWKSYQGIIPQLQCERVMRKPVYSATKQDSFCLHEEFKLRQGAWNTQLYLHQYKNLLCFTAKMTFLMYCVFETTVCKFSWFKRPSSPSYWNFSSSGADGCFPVITAFDHPYTD